MYRQLELSVPARDFRRILWRTDPKFGSVLLSIRMKATLEHWRMTLLLKWTTFLENRVSDIQDFIGPSNWRHVSSQLNPADVASRGISADKLIDDELWWKGPEFLLHSKETWPTQPSIIMENPPEQRK